MSRKRRIARYEGPHGVVQVHRVAGRYQVLHVNHAMGWRETFEAAVTWACALAGLPVVDVPALHAMTDADLQALASQRATLQRIRSVFRVPYPDERRLYMTIRRAARHILAARIHVLMGDTNAARVAEHRAAELWARMPVGVAW